ncbi:unnamed protein product [Owenia fusiformis]|uniref:Uncharacterized protein n=1 Tax=Owenia fusiformis TaxID=6347 RepID=A0A8J1XRF0_OWEFU|nr:unnamed protein product [Owenia fusiformis]
MPKSLFLLVFCVTLPVVADTYKPAVRGVRYFEQSQAHQNDSGINTNKTQNTTPIKGYLKFNGSKMNNTSSASGMAPNKSSTSSLPTTSTVSSSFWRNGTEPWNNTSSTMSPHGVGHKNAVMTGAIVGIVVGCLALIGLAIALGVYLRKKYRVRKYSPQVNLIDNPSYKHPDLAPVEAIEPDQAEMEWDDSADLSPSTLADDANMNKIVFDKFDENILNTKLQFSDN